MWKVAFILSSLSARCTDLSKYQPSLEKNCDGVYLLSANSVRESCPGSPEYRSLLKAWQGKLLPCRLGHKKYAHSQLYSCCIRVKSDLTCKSGVHLRHDLRAIWSFCLRDTVPSRWDSVKHGKNTVRKSRTRRYTKTLQAVMHVSMAEDR